jgi:hypothetical protein
MPLLEETATAPSSDPPPVPIEAVTGTLAAAFP